MVVVSNVQKFYPKVGYSVTHSLGQSVSHTRTHTHTHAHTHTHTHAQTGMQRGTKWALRGVSLQLQPGQVSQSVTD